MSSPARHTSGGEQTSKVQSGSVGIVPTIRDVVEVVVSIGGAYDHSIGLGSRLRLVPVVAQSLIVHRGIRGVAPVTLSTNEPGDALAVAAIFLRRCESPAHIILMQNQDLHGANVY